MTSQEVVVVVVKSHGWTFYNPVRIDDTTYIK